MGPDSSRQASRVAHGGAKLPFTPRETRAAVATGTEAFALWMRNVGRFGGRRLPREREEQWIPRTRVRALRGLLQAYSPPDGARALVAGLDADLRARRCLDHPLELREIVRRL